MKVIVAGSRHFNNYQFIYNVLKDRITSKDQIVEGGAKGVDEQARKYALKHNISFRTFDADWDENGKAAGPIRNAEMANYADKLIAFYDGKSRGTGNMIKTAKSKGLPVEIIEISL